MSGDFQVLIDSDAFVAWIFPDDALHRRASVVFDQLAQARSRVMATSWVMIEAATVLSNRDGQSLAREFLFRLEETQFPIIHIDEQLQRAALELFKQQEGRGVSVIDCGNAVAMKHLVIHQIFSFDQFYEKRLKLPMIPPLTD